MTVGKSISYYTGIFSTAVTASVNPTATMAVLSTLGAIENAAKYSPDSAFFNTVADTLNGIPVVNTAAELPIANPYAAVFLTIVAAIMIVLHSFAESKIVSQATIDKLDKFSGWIGVTALSLMPMFTTESLEKTARTTKNAAAAAVFLHAESTSVSAGAPWYVWVIGITTLILASVVYFCCYSCVDNIGTICAAIPVKGLNIVEQIIKALIHAGMILLQLTFPVVSFIISVILITLPMAAKFTDIDSDTISSIQGRYFLPLMPLLCMGLRIKHLEADESLMGKVQWGTCYIGFIFFGFCFLKIFGAI